MAKIKVEHHENVSVLRLDNGVANAIDPVMLDDLASALDAVSESGALVLAGNNKFFSMGFDLPHLISLNRAAMSDFFYKFNRVAYRLLTVPLPTVCAIAGHAVAGGHILTLTCDYRFAEGGKKIGLNEVKLGVPVPFLAYLMLRLMGCDQVAKEMVYEGLFLRAAEATAHGLIDAIHSQDSVEEQAIKKAAALAALPRHAFSAIKANRVQSILLPYETHARQKNETFLDCWFNPRTQELLKEAARKF
jgi:enoyl-CoA hydratase/carnithine racemase